MLASIPKTAIILAGGKSSRMGQDKGLLLLAGKPMIQHVIDVVSPYVTTILISTANPVYKQFGHPCYPDIYPNSGPLGGIYTGLQHSNTTINFVLSCDTPLIPSELIEQLVDGYSNTPHTITTIKSKGKCMPTIGIYERQCRFSFKKRLENQQLRLMEAVQAETYQVLQTDSIFEEKLININTRETYQKLL